MTSVTIKGSTFSDDDDPDTGFGAGGHRRLLIPLAKAIVEVAADVATDAQTAAEKSGRAGASATAAAASAAVSGAAAVDAKAASAVAAALASGSATARPMARPSLRLNFSNGHVVDPRGVFARATSARRVNQYGLREPVLPGVPRLQFDPVMLTCQGLLIEGGSTNVLTFSTKFQNWNKTGTTVQQDAAVAPDGTMTASRIVATVGATEAQVSLLHTGLVAGGPVATTIEAKAGEYSIVQIRWFGSGTGVSSAYANFDLVNGVFAGNADNIGMRLLWGGWWECFAGVNASGTLAGQDTGIGFCTSLGNGRRPAIPAADGVSGLYLAQAQTEARAEPTAIVPTTGSQLQRLDETFYVPAALWLPRAGEGTLVVEFLRNYAVPAGTAPRVLTLHDGTANNRIAIQLGRSGSSSQVSAAITTAGVTTTSTAANFTPGQATRLALAWNAAGVTLHVNGLEVWAANGVALPTALTTLQLGADHAGANHLNGVLAWLMGYPLRLASANLAAMTAA